MSAFHVANYALRTVAKFERIDQTEQFRVTVKCGISTFPPDVNMIGVRQWVQETCQFIDSHVNKCESCWAYLARTVGIVVDNGEK